MKLMMFGINKRLKRLPAPVPAEDRIMVAVKLKKYAKQLTTLLTDEEIEL